MAGSTAHHLIRRAQWLMLVLGPIAVLIGSARLLADVGRPFDGLITFNNVIRGMYEISSMTPAWWIVPHNHELPYGAGLRAADDAPYARAPEVFDRLWRDGVPRVRVAVTIDDVASEVILVLQPFTLGNFLDLRLPNIILACALWLTALALFRADTLDPLAHSLIFTAGLGAISYGLLDSSLFWLEGVAAQVIDLAGQVLSALISLSLVAIGCAFFSRRLRGVRWLLLICTAIWAAASVTLWMVARTLLFSEGMSDATRAADSAAYYTMSWLSTASMLILAACLIGFLIVARFAPQPPRMVRTAWAVLLALALAQPGTLFSLVNSLFDTDFALFLDTLDLRYFLLFLPLFPAMAIARFRMFGAQSNLLTLATIMTLAGLGATVLNALILGSMLPPTVYVNLPAPFGLVFSGLTVTGLFWAFQVGTVRGPFARLINPRPYRTQDLNRVMNALHDLDPNRDVRTAAVQVLRDQFDLSRVVLWGATGYVDREIPFSLLSESSDPVATPLLPDGFALDGAQWSSLLRRRVILLDPQRYVPLPATLEPLHRPGGVDILLALGQMDRPKGVIGLNLRRELDTLDEHDLTLIFQAGNQILDVLTLADEINANQVTRLWVHNRIQQGISWSIGRLEALRDQVSGAAAADTIGSVLDALHLQHHHASILISGQVIDTVSRLPGFTDLILERYGVRVTCYIDQGVTRDPDLDARLYRWVEEALLNVGKSAQASQATVMIFRQHDLIRVVVDDDGIGIDPNVLPDAETVSGLALVRRDVERLHGTMTLSRLDTMRGTRLEIAIPSG